MEGHLLFLLQEKVLYTSGYTDNALVHRTAGDQGLDFIQKPFTPTELAYQVRAMLDAQPIQD